MSELALTEHFSIGEVILGSLIKCGYLGCFYLVGTLVAIWLAFIVGFDFEGLAFITGFDFERLWLGLMAA